VRAAERLRVFFRLVNEGTGEEEPKEYELDPSVLRDILGVFKRFRFEDGRYRIYLNEPGKRERLILDVNVVEGKIVPPNFREAESKDEAAGSPQGEPAPLKPAAESDQSPQDAMQNQAKDSDENLDLGRAKSIGAEVSSQASLLPAVVGASVAMLAGSSNWRTRVQSLLAGGEIPRSKISRFLRRIRPR
jgi:hypothetical protein